MFRSDLLMEKRLDVLWAVYIIGVNHAKSLNWDLWRELHVLMISCFAYTCGLVDVQ